MSIINGSVVANRWWDSEAHLARSLPSGFCLKDGDLIVNVHPSDSILTSGWHVLCHPDGVNDCIKNTGGRVEYTVFNDGAEFILLRHLGGD